jgi:hypothetical protein
MHGFVVLCCIGAVSSAANPGRQPMGSINSSSIQVIIDVKPSQQDWYEEETTTGK